MRVGIIGLGLIGAKRLQIARSLGHEIAFVVDPKPPANPALRLEKITVVPDLEEIGTEAVKNLQALFVAVPHDLAADYCHWGIERGLHVICEKPLGISHAQAVGVARAAKAAGLVFSAGFNYRFLPTVVRLRQLMRSGQLGTVNRARFFMGHGGRPGMEAEWKLKKVHAGGGALIDPGVHLLDLARELLGDAEVIDSRLNRWFWDTDVEDNCQVRLRCGGAEVTVEVSLTSWKNQFGIEIYGTDGLVLISGRGGNYGSQTIEYTNRWFWRGEDKRLHEDFGTVDISFDNETKAFLQLIESGECEDYLSREDDGVAVLKLVECLYSTSV